MAAPLTVGLPDALSSRCQDAGAPLSGHRYLKPQWELPIVSTTAGCPGLSCSSGHRTSPSVSRLKSTGAMPLVDKAESATMTTLQIMFSYINKYLWEHNRSET